MNILIVLAHPDKKSFNHSIAETSRIKLKKNGHQVFFHDLYEEKFDPILETEEIPRNAEIDGIIQQHCNHLVNCDGIIIIHPNWWGQPPAILKGWIDRIIRPGVAYEFEEGDSGEGIPIGLLKAETALVFNTSDTSPERENNVFLDPLETIWKNCIFKFCGIKQFYRQVFRIMVISNAKQRAEWLREIEKTVDRFYPEFNPDYE